ncbi:MAG: CRISPR-associated RAMP protein [Chloroflexi bacterium]|nr:CRISPR-associated RAMP protein [Chloroflexota bacterium]
MTFDRFPGRFALSGRLEAVTALHIGVGGWGPPTGSDLPLIRDALGRPFIPGSTLKGALRAAVERWVRTVRPSRQRACAITGGADARCLTPTRLEQLRREAAGDEARLAQAVVAESCWVCQVFGAPWLASRVACADLPVIVETWSGGVMVREGVALDRDTETAGGGVRYDLEVIPAGTAFHCQIEAATDVPWQLGLLALALRELEAGRLALGAGRSRGLGRVLLHVERRTLVRRDADSLLRYLAAPVEGGEPVDDAQVASWVASALDALRADALPVEVG